MSWWQTLALCVCVLWGAKLIAWEVERFGGEANDHLLNLRRAAWSMEARSPSEPGADARGSRDPHL